MGNLADTITNCHVTSWRFDGENSTNGGSMKEFIEYIAKQLVDQPENVVIEEETKDEMLVLKLKVAQPDIGKVIGKRGRTAFALRTLVAAVGKKSGKKVALEIVD